MEAVTRLAVFLSLAASAIGCNPVHPASVKHNFINRAANLLRLVCDFDFYKPSSVHNVIASATVARSGLVFTNLGPRRATWVIGDRWLNGNNRPTFRHLKFNNRQLRNSILNCSEGTLQNSISKLCLVNFREVTTNLYQSLCERNLSACGKSVSDLFESAGFNDHCISNIWCREPSFPFFSEIRKPVDNGFSDMNFAMVSSVTAASHSCDGVFRICGNDNATVRTDKTNGSGVSSLRNQHSANEADDDPIQFWYNEHVDPITILPWP